MPCRAASSRCCSDPCRVLGLACGGPVSSGGCARPRRAGGTGALTERPWVALLPWSSLSQVLTRRQNCRDEFGGQAWGWGATLTAWEEQRDPVGCPERGSATQTSGFRGRATQAPGRTSGAHSFGGQAPGVAAVTQVTLCHAGPAPQTCRPARAGSRPQSPVLAEPVPGGSSEKASRGTCALRLTLRITGSGGVSGGDRGCFPPSRPPQA